MKKAGHCPPGHNPTHRRAGQRR